jgi:hypothetical protein
MTSSIDLVCTLLPGAGPHRKKEPKRWKEIIRDRGRVKTFNKKGLPVVREEILSAE